MAIAANASLISARSIEPISHPARSSACLTAGTGPNPNMPGLDRRDAVGDEPRTRLKRPLLGPGLVCEHHGGRRVVEAGSIAGGNGAVRAKGRLQSRQRLDCGVGMIAFVLIELRWPLFAGDLDRCDLSLEMSRRLRAGEALLRA